MIAVLISFREWLHSYNYKYVAATAARTIGSHLFQRVASFLLKQKIYSMFLEPRCSHLFQRVASFLHTPFFIFPVVTQFSSHLFQRVASFLQPAKLEALPFLSKWFSSLSESGFIPTFLNIPSKELFQQLVLISFREWLHSYSKGVMVINDRNLNVLISFREWLHSYNV